VSGTGAEPGADAGGGSFDWLPGTVVSASPQGARGRSLVVEVPGLRTARAGQHVDLRLTADDGYQATRSYSLSDVRGTSGSGAGPAAAAVPAAVPGPDAPPRFEITVERLDDGEVSPYLVDHAEPGDPIEVRGPIGGWFVWPPTEFDPDSAVHAVLPEPAGAPRPTESPVQLIGGGSGIAPLVAMVRARGLLPAGPEMRLLCSVRTPADRWFVDELDDADARPGDAVSVRWAYTRQAPADAVEPAGRLTRARLDALVVPAEQHPLVYVCGTNSFVEAIAGWLVDAGHDPTRVRTERFGGV